MKSIVRLIFAASVITASELSAQTVPVPTSDGPFRRIPNAAAVVKSRARTPESARRVCRGNEPGGWVAIDYVTDTIACPTKHGKSAENGTAILVAVTHLVAGEEIEVCADQRIPRNFVRRQFIDAPGRCPTLKGAAQSNVVVIRKSR